MSNMNNQNIFNPFLNIPHQRLNSNRVNNYTNKTYQGSSYMGMNQQSQQTWQNNYYQNQQNFQGYNQMQSQNQNPNQMNNNQGWNYQRENRFQQPLQRINQNNQNIENHQPAFGMNQNIMSSPKQETTTGAYPNNMIYSQSGIVGSGFNTRHEGNKSYKKNKDGMESLFKNKMTQSAIPNLNMDAEGPFSTVEIKLPGTENIGASVNERIPLKDSSTFSLAEQNIQKPIQNPVVQGEAAFQKMINCVKAGNTNPTGTKPGNCDAPKLKLKLIKTINKKNCINLNKPKINLNGEPSNPIPNLGFQMKKVENKNLDFQGTQRIPQKIVPVIPNPVYIPQTFNSNPQNANSNLNDALNNINLIDNNQLNKNGEPQNNIMEQVQDKKEEPQEIQQIAPAQAQVEVTQPENQQPAENIFNPFLKFNCQSPNKSVEPSNEEVKQIISSQKNSIAKQDIQANSQHNSLRKDNFSKSNHQSIFSKSSSKKNIGLNNFGLGMQQDKDSQKSSLKDIQDQVEEVMKGNDQLFNQNQNASEDDVVMEQNVKDEYQISLSKQKSSKKEEQSSKHSLNYNILNQNETMNQVEDGNNLGNYSSQSSSKKSVYKRIKKHMQDDNDFNNIDALSIKSEPNKLYQIPEEEYSPESQNMSGSKDFDQQGDLENPENPNSDNAPQMDLQNQENKMEDVPQDGNVMENPADTEGEQMSQPVQFSSQDNQEQNAPSLNDDSLSQNFIFGRPCQMNDGSYFKSMRKGSIYSIQNQKGTPSFSANKPMNSEHEEKPKENEQDNSDPDDVKMKEENPKAPEIDVKMEDGSENNSFMRRSLYNPPKNKKTKANSPLDKSNHLINDVFEVIYGDSSKNIPVIDDNAPMEENKKEEKKKDPLLESKQKMNSPIIDPNTNLHGISPSHQGSFPSFSKNSQNISSKKEFGENAGMGGDNAPQAQNELMPNQNPFQDQSDNLQSQKKELNNEMNNAQYQNMPLSNDGNYFQGMQNIGQNMPMNNDQNNGNNFQDMGQNMQIYNDENNETNFQNMGQNMQIYNDENNGTNFQNMGQNMQIYNDENNGAYFQNMQDMGQNMQMNSDGNYFLDMQNMGQNMQMNSDGNNGTYFQNMQGLGQNMQMDNNGTYLLNMQVIDPNDVNYQQQFQNNFNTLRIDSKSSDKSTFKFLEMNQNSEEYQNPQGIQDQFNNNMTFNTLPDINNQNGNQPNGNILNTNIRLLLPQDNILAEEQEKINRILNSIPSAKDVPIQDLKVVPVSEDPNDAPVFGLNEGEGGIENANLVPIFKTKKTTLGGKPKKIIRLSDLKNKKNASLSLNMTEEEFKALGLAHIGKMIPNLKMKNNKYPGCNLSLPKLPDINTIQATQ